MKSVRKALRFRSWINIRKKRRTNCWLLDLLFCTSPRQKDLVLGLSSGTICLITWCYVGHGQQESSDEMPHVLKLALWQIKDLIDRIEVKIPRAVCKQSFVRGIWRNGDWFGRQQKHRWKQGAGFKQPHHLATKQEDGRLLRWECVQRGRDKRPIAALLDRMLCW